MGAYGYRKSKLLLTDDQKPAWKAVEDAVDAFTQNMRAVCGTFCPTTTSEARGLSSGPIFSSGNYPLDWIFCELSRRRWSVFSGS